MLSESSHTIANKKSSIVFRLLPVGLAILAIAILWLAAPVRTKELVLEVYQLTLVDFFETSWLYYYLHIFTFIPVFLLSFDRRVHFFRSWRYLFPAIAIVGLIFILWDAFFTHMNVWGFNPNYFSGATFLALPIEEWLFFFTVPYACVFIYACLNYYVPKDYLAPYDRPISYGLILILLVVGILSWGRLYTSTTFLLTAAFIFFHTTTISNYYRTRFYLAFIVSLIPFLMVNGVLTGGTTAQPVVMYNPVDNLGIRIGSVPIEDAVYCLLLLMGVVSLMEHFRAANKPL